MSISDFKVLAEHAIRYYYADARYGCGPDSPFTFRRTLKMDGEPLEEQAQRRLDSERPGAILVSIENVDGLCDGRCGRPYARNRYIKILDLWYHFCEECYQKEMQAHPNAYNLNRALDHVGDMLAGRPA